MQERQAEEKSYELKKAQRKKEVINEDNCLQQKQVTFDKHNAVSSTQPQVNLTISNQTSQNLSIQSRPQNSFRGQQNLITIGQAKFKRDLSEQSFKKIVQYSNQSFKLSNIHLNINKTDWTIINHKDQFIFDHMIESRCGTLFMSDYKSHLTTNQQSQKYFHMTLFKQLPQIHFHKLISLTIDAFINSLETLPQLNANQLSVLQLEKCFAISFKGILKANFQSLRWLRIINQGGCEMEQLPRINLFAKYDVKVHVQNYKCSTKSIGNSWMLLCFKLSFPSFQELQDSFVFTQDYSKERIIKQQLNDEIQREGIEGAHRIRRQYNQLDEELIATYHSTNEQLFKVYQRRFLRLISRFDQKIKNLQV